MQLQFTLFKPFSKLLLYVQCFFFVSTMHNSIICISFKRCLCEISFIHISKIQCRIIFTSTGLITLPCGVPDSLSILLPSGRTKGLLSHLSIYKHIHGFFTCLRATLINNSWSILSNKPFTSNSITQSYFQHLFLVFSTASNADLCGLYPYKSSPLPILHMFLRPSVQSGLLQSVLRVVQFLLILLYRRIHSLCIWYSNSVIEKYIFYGICIFPVQKTVYCYPAFYLPLNHVIFS